MTDEQASDWEYKIICCLGISTSNSDINVVGLHKTVTELYEQGRADEREAQACCGDYEKCMKACTPRGRWLAEKELTKSEQEPVCDKDPFYCWSIRCQVGKVCKHTAQPEQKLNDPPAYVEPPTSDYHNGWEEGFEAAKNLYPKQTKREWASLNNMDITGAAHDEAIHPVFILETTKSGLCMKFSKSGEWHCSDKNGDYMIINNFLMSFAKAIESKLKEKNGG